PEAELYIQTADVRDFAQVLAVIDLAMEKFGRIDVLYKNAGIMPTAPLVEGHRDEWQNMLDINFMGVLNGISAVLPIMVKQKSGHIISTDSVAGHVVYP
ncbi:SDR family oxidoreductase, partial [Enterococcus faecium]|uniref:SDR family oxidoreductase n=1 Tax=Enterococcus faecium TaxID=1352 RepID=UPI003CC620BE